MSSSSHSPPDSSAQDSSAQTSIHSPQASTSAQDHPCCQSVNEQRTKFIFQVNTFLGAANTVLTVDYLQLLLDVDRIKTTAFEAFDELLQKKACSNCCRDAAKAIRKIAVQTLGLLFDPDSRTREFRVYDRFIKLILKANRSDRACCLGVTQAIQIFSTATLIVEGIVPVYRQTIRRRLQGALKKLLQTGLSSCCQAAGRALGQVAVGFINLGENLDAARAADLITNPDVIAQASIELDDYQKIVDQILATVSSKCSQCCSEAVSGIGRMLYRLTSDGFNYSLVAAYFYTVTQSGKNLVVTPFDELLTEPSNPDLQALYLNYLDLLRKIRRFALSQFEHIVKKAVHQKCCSAVAQGLADSTSNFGLMLGEVFIGLSQRVLGAMIAILAAVAALLEFSREYPPLARQIVDTINPNHHGRRDLPQKSADSSTFSGLPKSTHHQSFFPSESPFALTKSSGKLFESTESSIESFESTKSVESTKFSAKSIKPSNSSAKPFQMAKPITQNNDVTKSSTSLPSGLKSDPSDDHLSPLSRSKSIHEKRSSKSSTKDSEKQKPFRPILLEFRGSPKSTKPSQYY